MNMKDIYKHLLWVGCILCIAPLVVRGYMWGKCSDALGSGSQAKFNLPNYQTQEHLTLLLGAVIIAFVVVKIISETFPE